MSQAHKIAGEVSAGRRKAASVCQETLGRIASLNPQLNAFIELNAEDALASAQQVDDRIETGAQVGPLAGVPIAIKDNICTRTGHTTCGSKMLSQFAAPYNATVIEKLKAADAVIIGKTNLDEFAMGSSTESSVFGGSKNPWNTDYVPGGSSGGSAVAVASRMTPLALGSDTGGSIRQPASFCGVVGLKPTYGRVSRYGLVAYGSSLDQIGPFATSVSDAALLLGVISGHDDHDSTSVYKQVPDYVGCLADEPLAERSGSLRIGVPKEYFGDGLDAEVRRAVDGALEVYKKLGAKIVEVSLPYSEYSIAAYYLVATAEASGNLARYDGVHYGHRTAGPKGVLELYSGSRAEGFGPEVKRRIMLGTFALSAGYYDAFYNKALKVRRLIKNDFDQAFENVDVLACPVAPTAAFKFGEKIDDPLQMYLADIYTIACNLAGIPGVSVPCGFTAGGLPIGLQLLGPVFGESTLLQAARLFERETDFNTQQPKLS